MNVTEPIINAALLGTAAKEFIPNGLPETLEENFRLLQEKSEVRKMLSISFQP